MSDSCKLTVRSNTQLILSAVNGSTMLALRTGMYNYLTNTSVHCWRLTYSSSFIICITFCWFFSCRWHLQTRLSLPLCQEPDRIWWGRLVPSSWDSRFSSKHIALIALVKSLTPWYQKHSQPPSSAPRCLHSLQLSHYGKSSYPTPPTHRYGLSLGAS